MGATDKKISEFITTTSIAGKYVPLVDVAAAVGQKNQKITAQNLISAITNTGAWISAGQFTYAQFQAGTTIDANTKELQMVVMPQYFAITGIMLRNDSNINGSGITYSSISLVNDIGEFYAGNLLEDFTSGAANKKIKVTHGLTYIDSSNKLQTTGQIYKLRLYADVPIANLTSGSFSVFYKSEKIIP